MAATNTAAAPAPAAQQKNTGLRTFTQYLNSDATQNYLAKVLFDKKASFVNNLVALVNNNEKLQNCEPMGVMNAAIKATALNLPLDPNLGFAFIIPYKDNNTHTTKAQFQIGVNGLLQFAIRSGKVLKINTTDVREGELLDEDILTGDIKIRKVANRESKKIVGYAAYMKLANGFEKTIYSTREKVEAHALRFSKQQYQGKLVNIWASDFDAMAKKTVLKALLKYAPLTTEMEQALAADDDNQPTTTNNIGTATSAPETVEAEVISIEDEPKQPQQQPQQPQPGF